MSLPDDLEFDPTTFSGVARLFPLPTLVLFPHVLQPLHIFEPRYCDLLEAALADDKLIAMAVLAPGWEQDYEGRPDVLPAACLGRVANHVRLPDGRHNLLLAGVARLKLGASLAPTTSYRQARAEIIKDRYPAKFAAEEEKLQRQLLDAFRSILPDSAQAQAPWGQLLGAAVDLGLLTDIAGYTLDLSVAQKVSLLSEPDVYRRTMLLLEHLQARGAAGEQDRGFPPPFSAN